MLAYTIPPNSAGPWADQVHRGQGAEPWANTRLLQGQVDTRVGFGQCPWNRETNAMHAVEHKQLADQPNGRGRGSRRYLGAGRTCRQYHAAAPEQDPECRY